MKHANGSIRQGSLTHQLSDFEHERIFYPMTGVVLDVFPSDSPLNTLVQQGLGPNFSAACQARVLIMRGGTDTPLLLPNVMILPPGGSGYDNFYEELPTATTGTVDGTEYRADLVGVSPFKLNGDWCLAPGTRLLTASLEWKPIEKIKVGEELIGFDEQISNSQRLRPSVVEATKKLIKPCYEIQTDKGTIVASDNHMWVGPDKHGSRRWIQTQDLKAGDKLCHFIDPWDFDRSRDGGYLAGFLDGEGFVSNHPKNGNAVLGFGQNPGPTLDRVLHMLHERGFDWNRRNGTNECQIFRITGQSRAALRLLGMIRPERLLPSARADWEGSRPWSKLTPAQDIHSVKYIGEQEVVAVQTSTRTFIAEGFLSHNCLIQFIGGSIHQPVMVSWWPHPNNFRDPCKGSRAQRIARRFKGMRSVVTSKGSILVDTAESNHPLNESGTARTENEDGGDIRVTVKRGRELEVNFNPSVYEVDPTTGAAVEPEFLHSNRIPRLRETDSTRITANQDTINLLTDTINLINEAATQNYVLGQELKAMLSTVLEALAVHTHQTTVGVSAPPNNAATFAAEKAKVDAETILSQQIKGE